MQNRSFVVLKYKSIYYTFYNHFDSYPSHLGVLIIEDIKQIINENKYEELKEAVANMPFYHHRVRSSPNFNNIFECVRNPECYYYSTACQEPSFDLFIEYIYLIDFDNNKLQIKTNEFSNYKSYTLNLFKIPKNYLKVIEYNISDDEYYKKNESIKEEYEDEEEEVGQITDNIELIDTDTKEIIKLKIKLLETNAKIYKMKIKLLENNK